MHLKPFDPLYKSVYIVLIIMGSAMGLKWGGTKTIIELESEPKFNINL